MTLRVIEIKWDTHPGASLVAIAFSVTRISANCRAPTDTGSFPSSSRTFNMNCSIQSFISWTSCMYCHNLSFCFPFKLNISFFLFIIILIYCINIETPRLIFAANIQCINSFIYTFFLHGVIAAFKSQFCHSIERFHGRQVFSSLRPCCIISGSSSEAWKSCGCCFSPCCMGRTEECGSRCGPSRRCIAPCRNHGAFFRHSANWASYCQNLVSGRSSCGGLILV